MSASRLHNPSPLFPSSSDRHTIPGHRQQLSDPHDRGTGDQAYHIPIFPIIINNIIIIVLFVACFTDFTELILMNVSPDSSSKTRNRFSHGLLFPGEGEEEGEEIIINIIIKIPNRNNHHMMTSLVSSLCTGVHRMEKVKFGADLGSVCLPYNDLPAPLLILILKLNKEGPAKKDVFRAPGHQANMKKLIHVLQTGRLVNIDNFNIYTIASVLKKFLSKLPGGIFGPEVESRLFHIHHTCKDQEKRLREINR